MGVAVRTRNAVQQLVFCQRLALCGTQNGVFRCQQSQIVKFTGSSAKHESVIFQITCGASRSTSFSWPLASVSSNRQNPSCNPGSEENAAMPGFLGSIMPWSHSMAEGCPSGLHGFSAPNHPGTIDSLGSEAVSIRSFITFFGFSYSNWDLVEKCLKIIAHTERGSFDWPLRKIWGRHSCWKKSSSNLTVVALSAAPYWGRWYRRARIVDNRWL